MFTIVENAVMPTIGKTSRLPTVERVFKTALVCLIGYLVTLPQVTQVFK